MDNKIKNIIFVALFSALIFIATYIIRIPSIATGGYIHLGDGFIFLAVVILGKRYGALAGSIGGALSDMLAGYNQYILPTIIIKYIMGYLMGYIIEKRPNSRVFPVVGSIIGGGIQIILYYFVGAFFTGSYVVALSDIPGNIVQCLVGIIILFLLGNKLKTYYSKYI